MGIILIPGRAIRSVLPAYSRLAHLDLVQNLQFLDEILRNSNRSLFPLPWNLDVDGTFGGVVARDYRAVLTHSGSSDLLVAGSIRYSGPDDEYPILFSATEHYCSR